MKKIFAVFFLVLMVSCSEEPSPDNDPVNLRLQSISYTSDYENSNFTEIFDYNLEGKISHVGRIQNDNQYQTMYEYSGDMLTVVRAYDVNANEASTKSIINYNQDDAISQISNYDFTNGQYELASTVNATYGEDGMPSQIDYAFYGATNSGFKRLLYWENGNLTKMEEYGPDNQLKYEFFYTYDDHPNFKISNPYFFQSPENSSQNNLVKMDYTDHIGLLDIFCKPCTFTYEYNEEGLPIKIKDDATTQVQEITYEDGNSASQSMWLCGT